MILKHLAKKINANKASGMPIYKKSFNYSTITEWFRKFMNKIRFQDNRALQTSEEKVSIEIAQTPKQVDEKFIGDEQFKSIVQKQRMQKIDQILGTRTYFYQTKLYQEKLDSDHIMEIEELKKKHKQQSRSYLNWQNPQAQKQYKVKSSRKFFKSLKNLRSYPKHNFRIKDFDNEISEQNIDFLGKEALYSKLSLKWVDTYQKSLQTEEVDDTIFQLHSRRSSFSNTYFSTTYSSSSLYRIKQNQYQSSLLTSAIKFQELSPKITQIITLEQIYEILKQYYHDQRVSQWLKRVENGEINYLISGYQTNIKQDKFIFWIDLLGDKKQYVFLYKNLSILGNDAQEKNQALNNQQLILRKSLTPMSKNVIFNCKPEALFSGNQNGIYLVQRSEQGGYIQLIRAAITQSNELGPIQIIYRCKSYEELSIFTDQTQHYVFLRVNQYKNKYSEKLFIIEEKQEKDLTYEFIEITASNPKQIHQEESDTSSKLQQPQKKSTFVNWSPRGLIVIEYSPAQQEFLKYGASQQFATKVNLIPYKTHIQLSGQSSAKNLNPTYQLPQSYQQRDEKISAKQLDFNKRENLFECSEEQFISDVNIHHSHLIISLSTKSIYNRKRIYFLPFEQSKNPHSLIFQALKLDLLNFGYNYSSQTQYFSIYRTLFLNQIFTYTIWKKQLKEISDQKIHFQTIEINKNVKITVTCLEKYLSHLPKFFQVDQEDDSAEQKNLEPEYELQATKVPILIYLKDNKGFDKETNNFTDNRSKLNLRKYLEKGTMIVSVSCRGTLYEDLIKFHQGSGQNFENMITDLKQTIQWIGENLGKNISLYTKGNVSGLLGIMLNISHPFLFVSTVIHNGFFNLFNEKKVYFGKSEYFFQQNYSEDQKLNSSFWKKYNPNSFKFKTSKVARKGQTSNDQEDLNIEAEQQITQEHLEKVLKQKLFSQDQKSEISLVQPIPKIGTLQNIVISSSKQDKLSRSQSRAFIFRLRSNPHFRYQQVYLKEFDNEQQEQLFNLSYIYGKMKQKLEQIV